MTDVLELEDDTLDDYESDIESEDSEESDERVRRRRRVRPRTPSGQGLYRSRLTNNAVREPQLKAVVDRVAQQIKAQSKATQELATRVNTLGEQLDKEIAGRKKADVEQKKVTGQSSMNMMLPLLLMQGATEVSDKEGEKRQQLAVTTVPIATVNAAGQAVTETRQVIVTVDSSGRPTNQPAEVVTQNTKFKSTDMMLPLILMMGMGGMSGGSGGYGDNNMMMMLLVLMMTQKK